MIEVDFDDLVDATIAASLKESIASLEEDITRENRFPTWFRDQEKDIAAVKHLIHCMKVVADWHSLPSEGFFFDYNQDL